MANTLEDVSRAVERAKTFMEERRRRARLLAAAESGGVGVGGVGVGQLGGVGGDAAFGPESHGPPWTATDSFAASPPAALHYVRLPAQNAPAISAPSKVAEGCDASLASRSRRLRVQKGMLSDTSLPNPVLRGDGQAGSSPVAATHNHSNTHKCTLLAEHPTSLRCPHLLKQTSTAACCADIPTRAAGPGRKAAPSQKQCHCQSDVRSLHDRRRPGVLVPKVGRAAVLACPPHPPTPHHHPPSPQHHPRAPQHQLAPAFAKTTYLLGGPSLRGA